MLFLQMLQDLSPGSAYFRFGRHDLVDLSEDRILAICNPDPTRMVHFVVKATTGCGTRLAGNARYEIETAGQAEFVILVADPWQNCGVGRCLMQALIERASRDGLHSLHAQVLPSNRPMQQFLMKMAFEIERDSGKQPLRFIKKLI